jgi:hypothetical protein
MADDTRLLLKKTGDAEEAAGQPEVEASHAVQGVHPRDARTRLPLVYYQGDLRAGDAHQVVVVDFTVDAVQKDTRMSRGKGKAAMEPQDYIPLLKGRPSTRDLEGTLLHCDAP